MSQVSNSAIITAFRADLVQIFAIWSMTALVIHEYILTVSQEVAMIWRRKWSSVTWLFITNRYLMIAITIWTVLPATANVRFFCSPLMILGDTLTMAQYFIFAAFSALRVFAIWDRDISMTLLVLALNLVPVAINIYSFAKAMATFTWDPIFGSSCGYIFNIPVNIQFNVQEFSKLRRILSTYAVSLGARIAVIIGDILVLAFTWFKTFRHRMNAIRVGVQTPMSALLLRDGTVYFGALAILNTAKVLVNTVPSLQNASPVVPITNALTPILISRFLLNLRQVVEAESETQSQFDSRFSIPGFRVPTLASIVGNFGSDLDHGSPAEDADEEIEDVVADTADAPEDERCSARRAFFTDSENICG